MHSIPASQSVAQRTIPLDALVIKQLRKVYANGLEALKSIDLTVEEGDFFALLGPNGAGKTTIANLILGFYRPQEGRIYMDDQPLNELDVVYLRRFIGTVRQDPIFFPGTIFENITYGNPDIDPHRVNQMADLATAHEFINQLPNGYDTFVGEDGVQLSGGERQKIAIARALLRKPRLLILDEPTIHLDDRTVHKLVNNLMSLKFEPTILLISHDINIVKEAANIYVLHEGRILENGSYEKLDLEQLKLMEA